MRHTIYLVIQVEIETALGEMEEITGEFEETEYALEDTEHIRVCGSVMLECTTQL